MKGPRWFREALAAPRESRRVEVDGTSIHYLRWGNPANPPVMLVHGGSANAHWWAHVAPLLVRGHCVVAADLSGHGDSGWRTDYGYERWADELDAVGRHAGFEAPALMIGHSMGGIVTTVAAARGGLAGAVIVDSPLRRPDPESEEGSRGRMFRRPKTYPDLDTAVGHFHLVPPQPRENPFILDYVARNSLREVEEGWTWKFDPAALNRPGALDFTALLGRIDCRVALVVGEYSQVVPPDIAELMFDLLHRNSPVIEIPQAHHHLLLDQPLPFVVCLRTLLADWEHSVPRRRGP